MTEDAPVLSFELNQRRGFLLPCGFWNHWIILERVCYNRPSSSFGRKAGRHGQ